MYVRHHNDIFFTPSVHPLAKDCQIYNTKHNEFLLPRHQLNSLNYFFKYSKIGESNVYVRHRVRPTLSEPCIAGNAMLLHCTETTTTTFAYMKMRPHPFVKVPNRLHFCFTYVHKFDYLDIHIPKRALEPWISNFIYSPCLDSSKLWYHRKLCYCVWWAPTWRNECLYAFVTNIFTDVMQKYPTIQQINVFSDGANSQFKQRFLFSNLQMWEQQFHIELKWYFFATSHGKGVVMD